MRVTIQRRFNDPAHTSLDVYPFQNYNPSGIIDEDNFADILDEDQLILMHKGEVTFNVNEDDLKAKCKIWFK